MDNSKSYVLRNSWSLFDYVDEEKKEYCSAKPIGMY